MSIATKPAGMRAVGLGVKPQARRSQEKSDTLMFAQWPHKIHPSSMMCPNTVFVAPTTVGCGAYELQRDVHWEHTRSERGHARGTGRRRVGHKHTVVRTRQ